MSRVKRGWNSTASDADADADTETDAIVAKWFHQIRNNWREKQKPELIRIGHEQRTQNVCYRALREANYSVLFIPNQLLKLTACDIEGRGDKGQRVGGGEDWSVEDMVRLIKDGLKERNSREGE